MTNTTNTPAAETKGLKGAYKSRRAATKQPAKANTFTSVDLAAEYNINAKTLRARIRRNIDKWAPLFKDGERHVFADNATTRKAIAALLDA